MLAIPVRLRAFPRSGAVSAFSAAPPRDIVQPTSHRTESNSNVEKRGTVQPQQQNTNYPSNSAYGANQPTASQFADPATGGGSAVRIRHLEGRTCIFVPTGYNPSAQGMNPTDPPRPAITCDVLVLDGGEMFFGDNIQTHTPYTQKVATPYYVAGMLTSNSEIVRALTPSVGREIVLGRVVRGQRGNKPYLIERLEATDPRRELAAQVWTARTLGTFVNPTPEQLGVPAGQPAQQQVPAQGYAYPQAGATPQTYGQPSQAPNVHVPQGQPALQTPPGWNPEAWASLPDAQRAAILAAQQQQYGSQAASSSPAATSTAGPTGF
jgi:hypothetical protein